MYGEQLMEYYKDKDFSRITAPDIELEEYNRELDKIAPMGIYNKYKYDQPNNKYKYIQYISVSISP